MKKKWTRYEQMKIEICNKTLLEYCCLGLVIVCYQHFLRERKYKVTEKQFLKIAKKIYPAYQKEYIAYKK
jgi:hypothetical protein